MKKSENNNFEIVIPMGNVARVQVGPENTDKETNKETAEKIIDLLQTRPEITVNKIAEIMDWS